MDSGRPPAKLRASRQVQRSQSNACETGPRGRADPIDLPMFSRRFAPGILSFKPRTVLKCNPHGLFAAPEPFFGFWLLFFGRNLRTNRWKEGISYLNIGS